MSIERRALPLIKQIYASALDPSGWHEFAEQLSVEFGGAAVGFSLQVPGAGPPIAIYRTGFTDGFQELFVKFVANGKLPWGNLEELTPSQHFERTGDYFPDEELRQTDFFKEYMKPQGLAPEGPVVNLIHPSEGMLFSGLAIYRKQGARPFEDDDLRMGDLLVPHLAQAFGIHCRLGGVDRARLALGAVIDRMPTGVILLDRKRRAIVTNRAAQEILNQNDGIYTDEHGPHALLPRDDAALQDLIASVISARPGHERERSGFMAVSRPSGSRPYAVMMTALLQPTPETTGSDAAAVLFVTDAESSDVSTVAVLRSVYALTHAEAELVQLLVSGRSLEEVAKLRGVTMNTARSQLKHVFAKTDTRRQGELIRLIVTGVASLSEV